MDQKTKDILQAFLATSKMPNGGNFAFWVGTLIPASPLNFIQNTQPLYYAASFGLTEVVRTILETEKDIDIDAFGGRAHASALHVATYREHIDVVRLLLEKGADPNLPNNIGETPYYWAARFHNEDMLELLKRYGSDGKRLRHDQVRRGRVENFADSLHSEPIN
jgi:ankyrin repeat protein